MITTRTYQIGAFTLCVLVGIFTIVPIQAGISLMAYSLPVVVYFLLPEINAPGQQRFSSTIIGYSVFGAAVYLALYFMAGFFMKEIAGSPYDLTPLGILTNIGTTVPLLILREMTREYCLGVIHRNCHRKRLWVVLLVIFMVISSINFAKVSKFTDFEKVFIYLAVEFLPMITMEILLTVLVYHGGAVAGICYKSLIQIFLHVFPFLPDLPWIAESALGIAYPVFFALLLNEMYGVLQRKAKEVEKRDIGFYVQVMLAVLLCWFCVGVFPVYPSVILTGSMEPGILPGDIVLIDKLLEEQEVYKLKEGDIINFEQNNITITHRIIEVIKDEFGNVSFRTKGDNNKSPDEELVYPNNLNGVVNNVVPKVGIPMLLMKAGEKVPEGVVDNEEGITDEK